MRVRDEFEHVQPKTEAIFTKVAKLFWKPCSSSSRVRRTVHGFFPFLQWLPEYRPLQFLIPDIVGGMTVAILHVPQGIAYALLAGLKPISGLYLSFFAPFFYFFFGTSRHVSVSFFAPVALMAGVMNDHVMTATYGTNASDIAALDDYSDYAVNPVSIAATLAFLSGLIHLLIGVLKLDFICAYFSDPLVGGFTTGAAVHVLTSQVGDLMGVHVKKMSGPGYLFRVYYKLASLIPQCNLWTLGATVVAGAFMIVGKDVISPRINKWAGRPVTIPYDLVVLIVSTAISYSFDWPTAHGVPVVGVVPNGFPAPQLPQFSLLGQCLGTAVPVAVVSIAVHISMAKMLAKRLEYTVDPLQEIYALGLTSTFSGFFPVFPSSPALAGSMVLVDCGAHTQLHAVFTCALLLVVILWLGPLFECLPLCILSTVIVVALRPMFRKFRELPKLWRVSRLDCIVWVVAFAATVCIDVVGGLAVALAFVLCTVVLRTQWPTWTALVSKSADSVSRRVCVLRFEAPILFTNTERFKRAVADVLARGLDSPPTHLTRKEKRDFWFVLDCSAITHVDVMGLGALQEVLCDVETRADAFVAFVNCRSDVAEMLVSAGLALPGAFHDTLDAFMDTLPIHTNQLSEP